MGTHKDTGWRRLTRFIAQGHRDLTIMDPVVWTWFRLGYTMAIRDIERTGLRPMTDKTIRESADRALKAWSDGKADPDAAL